MDIKVSPGLLHGTVIPPASKSLCHREIICAALADGESRIKNVCFSDDIRATLRGAAALGAEISYDGTALRVRGGTQNALPHIDCSASATSLRLLIPIALALCGGAVFTGEAGLMSRPMEPYFEVFREKGIDHKLENNVLTLNGHIGPGEYSLPGDVSSQFFSGLLLALPLLGGASQLRALCNIQSRPYIEMTLDVMRAHGVYVEYGEDVFRIAPQDYLPGSVSVEADWSHAALWIAVRELGSNISVSGLNNNSRQGDRVFAEYAEMLRGESNVELDASQCPDIVPPLALIAALRHGRCEINNAARLRYKECDRLDAVCDVLAALGADIVQRPDGLDINGVSALRGGVSVDVRGDHRIAMMAAAASTVCELPVVIRGAECVGKSYPDFWRIFKGLGGAASAV